MEYTCHVIDPTELQSNTLLFHCAILKLAISEKFLDHRSYMLFI